MTGFSKITFCEGSLCECPHMQRCAENPLGKSVSIDKEEDTVKIEEKDLENALTAVQKRTATAIGAPQV